MSTFSSPKLASVHVLETTNSFKVYNASAGSGKTYALVKNYLSTILQSPANDAYKHLLAITFTNKAVAEMKNRIVTHLTHFADYQKDNTLESMQYQLCEELNWSPRRLKEKSAGILKNLLHNYAAFSIETIDSFNHRLLRTFAKDMGLNTNFEVSLDVDLMLQEAVDKLLAQAGTREELTQILIDFALYKTERDKSWDIAHDLFNIAKVLKNETDYQFAAQLKQKSPEDFDCLKNSLIAQKKQAQKSYKTESKKILTLLEDSGIDPAAFSRKSLPNYFSNLLNDKFPANWEAAWMRDLGEKEPYKKSASESDKTAIDAITKTLITGFETTKKAVIELEFTQKLLDRLTPHQLLQEIYNSFETIKKEQNLLPISAFNRYIQEQIKDQPAPFIYERLGEWYRHFYIDEFQDTSRLQWENMAPLITNALSQQYANNEQGSLLLVGDAKQSIYRWRGGEPEQFIALSSGQSGFPVKPDTITLNKNFRSHKVIIDFNNQFFTYAAQNLDQEAYKKLYLNDNAQVFNNLSAGFVQIDFIPKGKQAEMDQVYVQETVLLVKQCLAQGYRYQDICVLAPKKNQNGLVAQGLREAGIPIVSAESVLLKNAGLVKLLIAMLQLNAAPANKELQLQFYCLLQEHCLQQQALHDVLKTAIDTYNNSMEAALSNFGFDFNRDHLNSLGLYDALEYGIRALHLTHKITAFERFLLDIAHDYEQHNEASFTAFLDYWEKKQDSLSVQFPEHMNAVQLMTIHKAKGLEFPVVIFPFADANFARSRDETLWFPLNSDQYCGFEFLQIPFSKSIANYGQTGLELYEHIANQQYFDQLNVLYVALTRAANQLFVLTSTKEPGNSSFGALLCDFLNHKGSWSPNQTRYTFGAPTPPTNKRSQAKGYVEDRFISSAKESHNINLVAAPTKTMFDSSYQARATGQRLHDLLAQIFTLDDLDPLFNRLEALGKTTPEILEQDYIVLKQLIHHPKLSAYFAQDITVKNEVDLIDSQGNILRPDRLCFMNNGSISILDYKFGQEDSSYRNQVEAYAHVLIQMGYTIADKVLVYCNQEIQLDSW